MPFFFEIDFFALLTTIFWIWMLLDCIMNKRIKLFWLLFIFFTHMVGAVIYFLVACEHRNPVDALSYYISYIRNAFKRNAFKQKNPPTPQPFQTAPMPFQATSPPQAYSDYQQGYRAQHYEPAPVPVAQQEEPSVYHPQPQYEEQLTISYPEMPRQEQK
jgi:hypothetical protein